MPTTRLKSCTICAGASSLCESTGLDTPAHIVCKTDVLPLALRLPFTIFANGHFQPRQPMNKISFWLHNARHISLPQSILPAVLATGMAVQYDTFSWWLALIALFGVACAHLGMNLADDYFDYKVGSGEKRKALASEGMRARVHKYPYLTSGEATLCDLAMAICAFLATAAAAGVVVVIFRGTTPLIIAIVGCILGISYSGWPFRLSYHGYGELVIGMMFGPLLMTGVQYAACGVMDEKIILVSVAIGLLVTNILYTHSVLDRHADAQMDKLTLARLLKKRNAMLGASAVFCFVPFILMAAGVVFGILHWAYLFTLIQLPMAIFLWDSIRKFLYDIPVPLTVRPWMGPMGKFDKYCEAGIGWFMLRWLTARNLISFFALILLIVNVILKITHTLL